MAQRLYLIYCSHCHFKKLTDGSDLANFVEVKTCKDCGGARKFKCPQCGRLAKATKANIGTQTESQKHIEKIRAQQELEKEKRKKDHRRWVKERYEKEKRDE